MSLSEFVQEKVKKEKIRHSVAVQGLLKLSKTRVTQSKQSFRVPPQSYLVFYPKNALSNSPHSFKNGYNTGSFKVFCTRSHRQISLTSFDHGQYPWGRNQSKGAMSFLCKSLGIISSAQNTCLPTHILIGLIHFQIISVEEILAHHSLFIKNMLSSQHMLEDTPAIMAFMKKLHITDKVCFRSIVYIPEQGFVLLSRYFGNFSKKHIFLVHRNHHFFLGI